MIENLDTKILFSFYGLSVNATLFYTWVVMLLLGIFAFCATRHLSLENPSRMQVVIEGIVSALRRQIYETSRDNPARYLGIMGTFFLFIALSNTLTIIPWFLAPTASLSTTGALAAIVFMMIPLYGIQNQKWRYFKKYVQPTALMLPLNILSDFSSVFALAFRLYGNILGGAVAGSVLMMLVPFIVPLPLQMLGLVTGLIQAYIFTLLAVVYVSSVPPAQGYQENIE